MAEGTAVENLVHPDRVLIGGEASKKGLEAVEALAEIYSKWVPQEKIIKTNTWSSELSKLVSSTIVQVGIDLLNKKYTGWRKSRTLV